MEEHKIGDLYQDSFDILKNNVVVCIVNTIIAFISIILCAITIIGLLAIPAIVGGYLYSFSRMINGEKVDIGDFFKNGFNKFGKLLGVSILSTIGILLGFICFIIPGFYLLTRWFFVFYLIMDKDVGISEAFEYSWKMSDGIFWNIFVIIILNAIINAIGETLVIGLLLTTPLTYIVVWKYYFQRLDIMSRD